MPVSPSLNTVVASGIVIAGRPGVDGVAEEQRIEFLGDQPGNTEFGEQRRDRPRRSQPEVLAGHHDVSGRNLVGPTGAHFVEDVLGGFRGIHLHREGRVHGVGVEVIAEHPNLAGNGERHGVTLFGSVM